MMLEKLNQDLKEAMKSKDKVKLETVRLLKTALTNERIKLGVETLSEEDELNVIAREVKQRKDAISEFKKASREDLIEKEQNQLNVLETYLPEPLSEEEIKSLIKTTCTELNASSMRDMGKVMSSLTPQVKGRADMGKVSQFVKEYLNK